MGDEAFQKEITKKYESLLWEEGFGIYEAGLEIERIVNARERDKRRETMPIKPESNVLFRAVEMLTKGLYFVGGGRYSLATAAENTNGYSARADGESRAEAA